MGEPPKYNLFVKNFILTCFNVCHLQSTLYLMQYTYQGVFPLLKSVFELINFDAFQSFCCFLFYLFHIGKTFSFGDFFIQGNKKKNALKPNAASHNNASWSTDADGLLEHSPSGGSQCYRGTSLICLFCHNRKIK